MKNIIYIFIIYLNFSYTTKAQDLITDFLTGPINDSRLLIEGYMAPFGEWLGTGLNTGWYNTAKPHQFPGFDVTGGIHFITPPNQAKQFEPNLEKLIVNSADGLLPTFIGQTENTEISYLNPLTNEEEVLFNAPGGINWDNAIPMPYVQGSIGLIKKTEILFRIAPRVKVQDLKMGYFGIGFKHNIKQWIPVIKALPFDLSYTGGFSKLNSNLLFNPGQELQFNIKAFNSNIILSKKILGFTPYVGVGYEYSQSKLSLNGEYTILDWNGYEITEGQSFTISDPINTSFGGVNGFKANFGARLKLFLFTFHVEWTKAEYNIFTIGIGLNSDIGSKIIGGTIDKTISN
jgi:hypothetical protein